LRPYSDVATNEHRCDDQTRSPRRRSTAEPSRPQRAPTTALRPHSKASATDRHRFVAELSRRIAKLRCTRCNRRPGAGRRKFFVCSAPTAVGLPL